MERGPNHATHTVPYTHASCAHNTLRQPWAPMSSPRPNPLICAPSCLTQQPVDAADGHGDVHKPQEEQERPARLLERRGAAKLAPEEVAARTEQRQARTVQQAGQTTPLLSAVRAKGPLCRWSPTSARKCARASRPCPSSLLADGRVCASAHKAQQLKTPTEKPRSPAGTAKPTVMLGEYHGSEA